MLAPHLARRRSTSKRKGPGMAIRHPAPERPRALPPGWQAVRVYGWDDEDCVPETPMPSRPVSPSLPMVVPSLPPAVLPPVVLPPRIVWCAHCALLAVVVTGGAHLPDGRLPSATSVADALRRREGDPDLGELEEAYRASTTLTMGRARDEGQRYTCRPCFKNIACHRPACIGRGWLTPVFRCFVCRTNECAECADNAWLSANLRIKREFGPLTIACHACRADPYNQVRMVARSGTLDALRTVRDVYAQCGAVTGAMTPRPITTLLSVLHQGAITWDTPQVPLYRVCEILRADFQSDEGGIGTPEERVSLVLNRAINSVHRN